jgi:CubicO group peptidase (beta-lactamase class C family)
MKSDVLEETVVPEGSDPDHLAAFGGDALGFGLDVGVTKNPAKLPALIGQGSIWWGGAAGTWFWIDPKNDLFFIGLIQRFNRGATGDVGLAPLSQTLVYSALMDPAR